jgi:hypothetical protein
LTVIEVILIENEKRIFMFKYRDINIKMKMILISIISLLIVVVIIGGISVEEAKKALMKNNYDSLTFSRDNKTQLMMLQYKRIN